jgi:hypothetical protein
MSETLQTIAEGIAFSCFMTMIFAVFFIAF